MAQHCLFWYTWNFLAFQSCAVCLPQEGKWLTSVQWHVGVGWIQLPGNRPKCLCKWNLELLQSVKFALFFHFKLKGNNFRRWQRLCVPRENFGYIKMLHTCCEICQEPNARMRFSCTWRCFVFARAWLGPWEALTGWSSGVGRGFLDHLFGLALPWIHGNLQVCVISQNKWGSKLHGYLPLADFLC